MYAYLIGNITQKETGKIVLENNRIGYEIFVSNQTVNSVPFENETVKIYTYLNVREDEMSLYGFLSLEEKNLFLKLISVSGIGPKMAISILSEISISGLIKAIASEDLKTICKIKGLGKKTAERLLLELKDKINPVDVLVSGEQIENNEISDDIIEDALSALTGLGINKNEAYRLIKQVATKESTLEDIITNVLRGMGK